MTTLAQLQHALDLYGAAAYWRAAARSSASRSLEDAEVVASVLSAQARDAGCSAEQIADAALYAASCVADHRKPLKAEVSFEEFRRVNGI